MTIAKSKQKRKLLTADENLDAVVAEQAYRRSVRQYRSRRLAA
jgi:hypothetical protein